MTQAEIVQRDRTEKRARPDDIKLGICIGI